MRSPSNSPTCWTRASSPAFRGRPAGCAGRDRAGRTPAGRPAGAHRGGGGRASRNELGKCGLAARKGCRSSGELIERVTQISGDNARKRIKTGRAVRARLSHPAHPAGRPRYSPASTRGSSTVASCSAIASSLALTVTVVGLFIPTTCPDRTDFARSFLRLVERFFLLGVGRRRGSRWIVDSVIAGNFRSWVLLSVRVRQNCVDSCRAPS